MRCQDSERRGSCCSAHTSQPKGPGSLLKPSPVAGTRREGNGTRGPRLLPSPTEKSPARPHMLSQVSHGMSAPNWALCCPAIISVTHPGTFEGGLVSARPCSRHGDRKKGHCFQGAHILEGSRGTQEGCPVGQSPCWSRLTPVTLGSGDAAGITGPCQAGASP